MKSKRLKDVQLREPGLLRAENGALASSAVFAAPAPAPQPLPLQPLSLAAVQRAGPWLTRPHFTDKI